MVDVCYNGPGRCVSMTYQDAPQILREFLSYHETIKAQSPKTISEYYLDLRMFLRFMKLMRDELPYQTDLDTIDIRGIDLKFLAGITTTDVYDFLSYLANDRELHPDSPGVKEHGLGASARARKLSAIKSVVSGKRVILVDDSIVRGTTCARTVRLLREAGATQVHMRVSSPPFIHPCYFGTDVPSKDKLIACRLNSDVEAIAKEIGVDSLGYLSVEDIRKIAVGCGLDFCVGCFTGEYPAPAPEPQPADKFAEKYEE